MDIISKKEEMIFKNEKDGKVSYSIGLSKKKEDGSYENGYMPCRFKKDVSLNDKTKIRIKNAWLDFYKIEKRTLAYIFINEFEKAEEPKKEEKNTTDDWYAGKDIVIPEEELPFY